MTCRKVIGHKLNGIIAVIANHVILPKHILTM